MSELADKLRNLRDQYGPDHPATLAAFEARKLEVLAEERQAYPEAVWWWLSFVDTNIAATIPLEQQVPGGPSFLGACLVKAHGPSHAIATAWERGINPGGEVRSYPIRALPDDVADKWAYRLLSTSDIEALDADPLITDGTRLTNVSTADD